MRAEVVPGCGAGVRREVCGVWLWCLWAVAGPGRTTPSDERAARGLRGLVVVPVGGGGSWPGFEIDHSERSSCVAISRAGRRPQAQPAGSSGQVAGDGGRCEVCGVWLWCLWAAVGPGAGLLAAMRGRREVCGVWLWCLWAVAGPGRASRSTTPSEARVWRSRGRAAAHRRNRPDQVGRPRAARKRGGGGVARNRGGEDAARKRGRQEFSVRRRRSRRGRLRNRSRMGRYGPGGSRGRSRRLRRLRRCRGRGRGRRRRRPGRV